MGIANAFMQLAQKCAKEVKPTGVPCCGMAGDRGMRYPELTAAALQHLNTAVRIALKHRTSSAYAATAGKWALIG